MFHFTKYHVKSDILCNLHFKAFGGSCFLFQILIPYHWTQHHFAQIPILQFITLGQGGGCGLNLLSQSLLINHWLSLGGPSLGILKYPFYPLITWGRSRVLEEFDGAAGPICSLSSSKLAIDFLLLSL